MGVVYRAHDEQLDRDVALKMLPPGTLADEATRTRFREEALALAKLDHPNAATIHQFGSQNGVDFLVTAYIPGITLDKKIDSGALPEAEVISLGIQLAERSYGGSPIRRTRSAKRGSDRSGSQVAVTLR